MKAITRPLAIFFIFLLSTVTCPLPVKFAGTTPAAPDRAQLEPQEDEVWHKAASAQEQQAHANLTVGVGDEVWTAGGGSALLRWSDLLLKLYEDGAQMAVDDVTPAGAKLALRTGTVLAGFDPVSTRPVEFTAGHTRIVIVHTMVMISVLPADEIVVVRVFEGEVEVAPLDDPAAVVTAGAGEWVLVDGDTPPVVSTRLFDMRKFARALDTWDVYSHVEQDVYGGFGITSANEVPPSDVLIVFGEVPTLAPTDTPTITPTFTSTRRPTRTPTHTRSPTPTRRPTRTPTRTPTPIVCAPGVIYCADFESGRAEGWQLQSGWRVTQEGTNQVLRGSGHQWATYPRTTWTDYRFSMRLKLVQGLVHLNYRVVGDPWSRYFISFQPFELDLGRQRGEQIDTLKRVSISHTLGVWHDVEIAGWDGHLRVTVDGDLELEYVDDNPLTRGYIAFETLEDSIALVDDIEIRRAGIEPPISTPTPFQPIVATPAPTRTPTATPTSRPQEPRCEVVSASLNIRSGPGTNYPTVRSALANGTALIPLGRIANNSWIQVQVVGSYTVGWVSAASQYTSCNVPIGRLPELEAPPTPRPPTPTFTPTFTPTTYRPPPSGPTPVISCSANPAAIAPGGCSTLRWDIDNVRTVHLDGAPVTGHSSRSVCPTTTQDFTLRISTGTETRTCTMRVVVDASLASRSNVEIACRAEPATIAAGGCSTLSWDIEGVKDIHLDGAPVIGHDSRNVCPSTTQSYTLRINTGSGDRTCTMTVNVGADTSPPVVSFVDSANWCQNGQVAVDVADASPPLDVQMHFVNKTTLYLVASVTPSRDWALTATGGNRYVLDFGYWSMKGMAGTTLSAVDRLGYRTEVDVPNFECGGGGLEYGIDRPGDDIRGFVIAAEVASPALCQQACIDEPTCVAFTYGLPGVWDADARCWIKSQWADPVTKSCCVSAIKTYGWGSGGSAPALENNTDRAGMDYGLVEVPYPEACRDACMGDPRCRAFTACPQDIPGDEFPPYNCWLKEGIPAASYKDWCTSGYR